MSDEIPDAVKTMDAEADAAMAEYERGFSDAGRDPEPTPPDEKPDETPAVTPSDSVAEGDAPLEDVQPEPEVPEKVPQKGDIWEQRYRTLAGKYDAEVPRLHRDLAKM